MNMFLWFKKVSSKKIVEEGKRAENKKTQAYHCLHSMKLSLPTFHMLEHEPGSHLFRSVIIVVF